MSHKIGAIGALLALLVACDPFETTNGQVDKGVEAMQEGNAEEAALHFEQAREELPESGELHYNVGTAYLAAEQYEKAEEALARSVPLAAGPLKAQALANLGLARFKLAMASQEEEKRKELLTGAMSALQESVILDPAAEAPKKNLELVLLQLYPPCDKREDEMESNNSAAEAKEMSETVAKQLLLCPGNPDYFGHELKKGDRVTLKVSTTAQPDVGAPPVLVQDSEGRTVVSENVLASSRELKFVAEGDGRYLFSLSSQDEEERPYQLEFAVLPDCASMPDPFEPNNSRAQAKPVEQGTAQHRVCPGDEDYFVQPLKRGESIWLQAQAQMVQGELSVEILDSAGNIVSKAARAGGEQSGTEAQGAENQLQYWAVFLDSREEADYFVRIAGASPEAEGAVTLAIMVRPSCPEGDDELEENDSVEDASDLATKAAEQAAKAGAAAGGAAPGGQAPGQMAVQAPTGQPGQGGGTGEAPIEMFLRRCEMDDDWFWLVVKPDAPQQVQIAFQHDKGDLALQVFEDGQDEPLLESNQSSGAQNGEGVVLAPAEETKYLIKVTGGADQSNFYKLTVSPPQNNDQNGQNNEENEDDKEQQDKEKKDQEEQKQEEKKPIEQAMDQLDKEKRPNIEAQKEMRENMPTATGKPW